MMISSRWPSRHRYDARLTGKVLPACLCFHCRRSALPSPVVVSLSPCSTSQDSLFELPVNEWPTSSNGKGRMRRSRYGVWFQIPRKLPWYRVIARENAGKRSWCGCSFGVCHWFSYPASATPYIDTYANVWNRDDGRENNSDVPTRPGRPSEFWDGPKGDVNRSWINAKGWSKRRENRKRKTKCRI